MKRRSFLRTMLGLPLALLGVKAKGGEEVTAAAISSETCCCVDSMGIEPVSVTVSFGPGDCTEGHFRDASGKWEFASIECPE